MLDMDDAARLALLEAEVAQLRQAVAGGDERPKRRWSPARRQRTAVLAGVVLASAAVMGVAAASTPGNPADVTFIPLSVPHKILSNVSIAKAATNSTAVNGGSTTVPTDATSVRMTVAVKSSAAGSLSVFPTDNAASTSADTISFAAGNVVTTQVTEQSPGLSGKVSFKNNGTATAVVTVTLTGYSTQTTASNISGSGGSSGQVLTNNGTGGAVWHNLPAPSAGGPAGGVLTGTYPNPGLANGAVSSANLSGAGSSAGQVLTSTGGAVAWATPKVPGWQEVVSSVLSNPANSQTGGSVTCPAGKVLLGGGAVTGATTPGQQQINSSYPLGNTVWEVFVDNTSAANYSFQVWAICGTGP